MSNVFHRSPGKSYPVAERLAGLRVWDAEGRRYLDGSGGASVVTVGHGVSEIRAAAATQLAQLAFAHGSQFTSAAAPRGLEIAVKLALQYWREVGQPDRYKVISRWSS